MGSASKVLEIEGAVCERSEHEEMAEVLEIRGVGVANRGEDEIVGRKGTEIQVSGSTATFLGGSSPHSEKTSSFPSSFDDFTILEHLFASFVARSWLTVRMHLRRSSACPARLPMLTHPRSLRLRGLHQHSSESGIQYKELTKLWSMRKCFHKGSSHSSGISAQQRGQPASELRGSGQGRRRCK